MKNKTIKGILVIVSPVLFIFIMVLIGGLFQFFASLSESVILETIVTIVSRFTPIVVMLAILWVIPAIILGIIILNKSSD